VKYLKRIGEIVPNIFYGQFVGHIIFSCRLTQHIYFLNAFAVEFDAFIPAVEGRKSLGRLPNGGGRLLGPSQGHESIYEAKSKIDAFLLYSRFLE
jgi:hypothetical protein